MHRKVAAALVAALALVAAGCGGSESLTRAQLVDRIEAACRQAEERTTEAARSGEGDNFLAAPAEGQQLLAERVEGLEPPDELSDDFETLKSGLAERADLLADLADTPRAEQQRAMAELGRRLNSVSTEAEEAMRAIGVRACD